MSEEKLNKILNIYAKKTSDDSRLKNLESDVWQLVAARRRDEPVGAFEGFLAFIFPAQRRFAPVFAAVLLGVILGFGTWQHPVSSLDAAEALNFKVFKSQVVSLAFLTSINERL